MIHFRRTVIAAGALLVALATASTTSAQVCDGSETPEGEPVCSDGYVDTFNGGINSTPPVYSPITCGESVCGEAGTFDLGGIANRDTDFYLLNLAVDTQVTWTVSADGFAHAITTVDPSLGVVVGDFATSAAGEEISVTNCLPAGAWALFVSTANFTGVPCGSQYVGTVTCTPCVPPPPLCGPGAGDCFSDNGTPGCENVECCEAVCALDPFCCDVLWDGLCASEAAELCARPNRPSHAEKGSLLLFSKVDLRWDAAGGLLQDTFLSLTNDYPADVRVQMYFINGDPPLDEPGVRFHPGWNKVDNLIQLTGDQPTYWSALSGLPAVGGLAPFTSLDPGFPPGRPVGDGSGDRMLRGYVIAWAVDADSEEIRWNHLSGAGTLVNYADGTAWEYNALSHVVVADVPNGAKSGSPGVLNLDGLEYSRSFAQLLMNYQAVGSGAFSGARQVVSELDVTLHPVSADLRQDTCGPVTTKAKFDIWNMNEIKFSELERCITCWDQTLGSDYETPNHFMIQQLQTDHGKARIDGLASQVCDVDIDPNDGTFPPGDPCDPRPDESNHPDDVVSIDTPLAGLVARLLSFDGGADHGASGVTMVGLGDDGSAVIRYDLLPPPPEAGKPVPGGGERSLERSREARPRPGIRDIGAARPK
jgi:hypothetical protein